MSKLVLFTTAGWQIRDGGTGLFDCTFSDELHFSRRLGEKVLIAEQAAGYVALARLDSFASSGSQTMARLTEIRLFPVGIAARLAPAGVEKILEISDRDFEAVIGTVGGQVENNESVGLLSADMLRHDFTNQLAAIHRNRCVFSDVYTEEGVATIIRPLDQDGQWHVSNFLFLHPEPADLFTRFAWTVGPQFEIIIGAHAMGPDIADTMNRTTMLAISERTDAWPDREALKWHRHQFAKRWAMLG